jgi:hypothetical protein
MGLLDVAPAGARPPRRLDGRPAVVNLSRLHATAPRFGARRPRVMQVGLIADAETHDSIKYPPVNRLADRLGAGGLALCCEAPVAPAAICWSPTMGQREAVSKTVFISSTFEDLAEHRRAVWQVLKEFRAAVRGMEEFGARTAAPLETCLAEVEQSDVYVGIMAFRLGTVDPESSKSYTQLEYERARDLNKEIFIYLVDEQRAKCRVSDFEFEPLRIERLKAFKALLKERHTVGTFLSPEDLAEKLKRDFAKPLTAREPPIEESEAEFARTLSTVQRFMLVPRAVDGREIRLKVEFLGGTFPAARELCRAFNLQYGFTIGSHISVRQPEGSEMKRFRELYASSHEVDRFLALVNLRAPVDLYARLQFTEQDIRNIQAQFFGESYYDEPDFGDPNERYVAPEGKVILLFSKQAPV